MAGTRRNWSHSRSRRAFTADKAFQQNLDLGSKRGWTLDRIVELNDRAFLMIWDRGIAGEAPDVAT